MRLVEIPSISGVRELFIRQSGAVSFNLFGRNYLFICH